MEDLAMQDEQDASKDWVPPAPRAATTTTLRTKAEMLVRMHGLTFGMANGKRCIHSDEPIPDKDYQVIAEAMRKKMI